MKKLIEILEGTKILSSSGDLDKIIHYCEMEIDFIKKKNDEVTHAEVEEFAAEIAQMQDA